MPIKKKTNSKPAKSTAPESPVPSAAGTKSGQILKNAQIREIVLNQFKKQPSWDRKRLIAECLQACPLSPSEIENISSSSLAVRYKGLIGSVLAEMIQNGDLTADDDRKLSLAKETGLIFKEQDAEEAILALLEHRVLNKPAIMDGVQRKTAPKPEEVPLIRSVTETVLDRLVKNESVECKNGTYRLHEDSKFPTSEIGSILYRAEHGGNLYNCFIQALNLKGGEFFEFFAAKLIEKYFILARMHIDSSNIVGGSDDNGIDVIIETTDWLGYREKVFVQAKVKSSTAVTLKEVREFYGALCAEHGTRGIFITTSTFHMDATTMLSGIYNLIAIDNRKLFEMAKYCEVGFRREGTSYVLDEQIFLE